jgi:hypothetical protein
LLERTTFFIYPARLIRHSATAQRKISVAEVFCRQDGSVKNQYSIQRGYYCGLAAIVLAASLILLAGNVRGQEALRLSLAGDVAATIQHQASSSIGYYNLLWGTTSWRFASALGLEYNDNVRLQQNGEGDFIIRPALNTQFHWPITVNNSLDATLGVGYSEYLQHPDLSQFFLTPGSGISFDIYAGDFKINLHDRASISEYAYQNAGVSGGNRDLISLENTAGINTLWDLDRTLANLGFDHNNYISLSQNRGEPDATSENLYANAAIRVRPELLMGVEAGGSVITYSQTAGTSTPITDAVQWNAGVFSSLQLSDHISVRADAGYTVFTPNSGSTNVISTDTSGLYFQFSLSHRVNRFVSYTLSAGRTTDLAAYGQAQSYYFVRLNPSWTLFKNYSFSTPLWWQSGELVYHSIASRTGNYEQLGAGVTVGRSLTKKLSTSASYQFVEATSSHLANQNYTENIVDLNFTYQF